MLEVSLVEKGVMDSVMRVAWKWVVSVNMVDILALFA
jgi:hypothetical protein